MIAVALETIRPLGMVAEYAQHLPTTGDTEVDLGEGVWWVMGGSWPFLGRNAVIPCG